MSDSTGTPEGVTFSPFCPGPPISSVYIVMRKENLLMSFTNPFSRDEHEPSATENWRRLINKNASSSGSGDQSGVAKPWWKKWWGILLIGFAIYVVVGMTVALILEAVGDGDRGRAITACHDMVMSEVDPLAVVQLQDPHTVLNTSNDEWTVQGYADISYDRARQNGTWIYSCRVFLSGGSYDGFAILT